MKKLLKRQIKGIEIGSVITISVAHQFIRGHWDNYTEHKYQVLSLTPTQINGRNIDFKSELISIKRKDLDEGYFAIKQIEAIKHQSK
jgi:hypothetical protein